MLMSIIKMPYDNLPDCLKEVAKLLIIKNCLHNGDKSDDNITSNIARKYCWEVLNSKLSMYKYENGNMLFVDFVNI